MKTRKKINASDRKKAKAAAARPVRETGANAPPEDGGLLNLSDETDHTTGQQKLAADEAIQKQATKSSGNKRG